MNKSVLCGFFILFAGMIFSQKKKEIKKHGIKAITVTEVKISNVGEVATEDAVTAKAIMDEKNIYDKEGRLAEHYKYGKDGALKAIVRYKYNTEDDVIEEAEYDDKNNLKEKQTVKYNKLGEKTEELITDKDGKQVKRHTYSYDASGLKTERKTYDAANTLVLTKKYTYAYK